MDYALIMAGGAGTRLWPLSREHLPKPALRLYGDKSMFEIAMRKSHPSLRPTLLLSRKAGVRLRQLDWQLFT